MRDSTVGLVLLGIFVLLPPAAGRGQDCDGNGIDDSAEVLDSWSTVAMPSVSVVADLDGDQMLDLAGSDATSGDILVRRNLGGRSFGDASRFATGFNATPVLAADLDGDGDLDLVAEKTRFDVGTLSVLKNDGAGRFLQRDDYDAARRVSVVAALDFDGDGDRDLAAFIEFLDLVHQEPERTVAIYVNDGNGVFRERLEAIGRTAQLSTSMAADFDGDGYPDLALRVSDWNTILVRRNLGTGGADFDAPAALVARGFVRRFAPTDLDGDGAIDIVAVTDKLQASDSPGISVFLNKNLGPGQMAFEAELPVSSREFYDAKSSDMDGDGLVDLVAADLESKTIVILLQQPDGRFHTADERPTPSQPSVWPIAPIAADLDGDGRHDVWVAHQLFWSTPLSARQDLDGNGRWDACDPDCDENRLPDAYEVLQPGKDRNLNGVLDACDPDCSVHPDGCDPRPRPFLRGNANGDAHLDASDTDKVFSLSFLGGSRPPCLDAADANDDGRIDTSDVVYLDRFLFLGGPPPPSPVSEEGLDPTPDGIGCTTYLPAAAPPLDGLALRFRGPSSLAGDPGSQTLGVFDCVLDRAPAVAHMGGAQGWSISLSVDGGTIRSISTTGTDAEAIFADGYVVSEVTPGPSARSGAGGCAARGNVGAVSAVVLSSRGQDGQLEGDVSVIARSEVEFTIPAERGNAAVRWVDGCQGSGLPVDNVVTVAGRSHGPALVDATVELRSNTGGLQLPSDANQDASVDLSDAVWLLGHLFLGDHPTLPCEGGTAAAPGPGELALLDSNGDGGIDLSDAVLVLGWLFLGQGNSAPVLGTACTPIAGCPDACGP